MSRSSVSANPSRELLPYTSELDGSSIGVRLGAAASRMASVALRLVSMVRIGDCTTRSTPTAAAR